jgi:hypothetical protein
LRRDTLFHTIAVRQFAALREQFGVQDGRAGSASNRVVHE